MTSSRRSHARRFPQWAAARDATTDATTIDEIVVTFGPTRPRGRQSNRNGRREGRSHRHGAGMVISKEKKTVSRDHWVIIRIGSCDIDSRAPRT
jgi:hypothetical protein